ncbi:MAG: hypothetical protein DWQ06_02420 [Calditrichaeota bacterium]|nr:MAG: hypothetical protein DWQ06_02420 [Calditrichota bacterium]
MSYQISQIKARLSQSIFSLGILFTFTNEEIRQFFLKPFSLPPNSFESLFVLLLIIFVTIFVLIFPFKIWSNFYLEQKFGDFEIDFFQFLFQELKSFVLSFFLVSIFSWILVWCIFEFSKAWFLVLSVILGSLNLFFAKIFPALLMPFFYELKPFENHSLKTKIKEFLKINLEIFVAKGAKVEAKIYGFGGTSRKILLSEGLLERLDENEILAVLSHELGHLKKYHNLKKIIYENYWTIFILFCADFILGEFLEFEFLLEQGLVYLLILVFIFHSLVSVVENYTSRKFELEADLLAVKFSGKNSLKSALLKIEETETLPKWIEFLFLSHPTLERRLKAIENFE